MFHSTDGLFFERQKNGDVRMEKRDGNGVTTFEQIVPAGIWVSAVLSMTAYKERPGDWYKFIDHHQGAKDVLNTPASQEVEATENKPEVAISPV